MKNYYIETKMEAAFQFRITDVRQAVKARGYKKDVFGKVIIKIKDEYASFNSAKWLMKFQNGKVAEAAKTDKKEDISLSIQEFSHIYTGYRKASEIAIENDVPSSASEALALLDNIFFDKPTYLVDGF